MTDQLPMPVTAPLTQAQKTQIINLIRRAARAEIMPRFRRLDAGEVDTKRDETDLVTQADTAAEAMITRGLQMAFPHALVIGEEAVSANPKLLDGVGDAELCFIIDPVDGTWNFAKNMPLFGTMVAACRFGVPVFGLIYDPVGNDLIMADNSNAAEWLTQTGRLRAIQTARTKPLDQLAGYAHIRLMTPADQALMWTKVGALAFVGSLRCSAHEYRLVATGAVDFLITSSLNSWDHAAGALICQQAGGKAAMLDGSDYNAATKEGYLLTASSPEVWDTLAAHFADLMSDE
ncbi:inositol monophosphatase [Tateyamaria omphalii]|uniref:inositol monophosphatase family protein n=1 Tax=Tateyamaria omphalii TaxID=299262 RepID=UPI001C99897A|nr:inositol monophosphatase [Tateyamaria omphalii]MBY5934808.1 inositol monophosphatase [Tateyamaria omphalii]